MDGVTKEAEAALQEMLGAVPEIPPVHEKLDARLTRVAEGEATFDMEADARFHNLVNVVHGGVLTSLAELAASTAIVTTLDEDEAFTFVSQTTNYERPVIDDTVEAHASIVRRGSRISFIQVRLTNDDEEEVARAEFTALSQAIDATR